VENREFADGRSWGFQIANDPFGNLDAFTHSDQAVWTLRLNRAHGCDVFSRQRPQVFLSERSAHHNGRVALQLVNGLIWPHVTGQQAEAERFHARRSNREEGQSVAAPLDLHYQRVRISL